MSEGAGGETCTCVENVRRWADHIDNVMRDCEVHPYWPKSRCRETYDKPERQDRSDTHICALGAGHPGSRYCTTCRSEWETRHATPSPGESMTP